MVVKKSSTSTLVRRVVLLTGPGQSQQLAGVTVQIPFVLHG